MIAMTSSDLSGVPADVAAVRSSIEHEIAGSTLLTAYAETVAAGTRCRGAQMAGRRRVAAPDLPAGVRPGRDAALGLAATGLRPGEFAAVWSRNRSEATIADYAVMHARGVPVFIYPTIAPDQAADLIGHCEATVVLAEREFLPVLDSIRARLPQLRALVVFGDDDADGTYRRREARPGRRRTASSPGRNCSTSAAPRRTAIPAAFERSWRQVTPDTPGDADLHLGHHRALQGCHDHPQERPLRAAGDAPGDPARGADRRGRRRQARLLPAHGARHRALRGPLGADGAPGHAGLLP